MARDQRTKIPKSVLKETHRCLEIIEPKALQLQLLLTWQAQYDVMQLTSRVLEQHRGDSDPFLKILDEAVGRMVGEERVAPSQITILGDSRSFVEDLQGSIIGGTSVGDLDSPGVVAETIHRFKGLENDVVIVALHEVETEQQRRLAYIGMSRAKGLMIVVGSKHVKRAIGW